MVTVPVFLRVYLDFEKTVSLFCREVSPVLQRGLSILQRPLPAPACRGDPSPKEKGEVKEQNIKITPIP